MNQNSHSTWAKTWGWLNMLYIIENHPPQLQPFRDVSQPFKPGISVHHDDVWLKFFAICRAVLARRGFADNVKWRFSSMISSPGKIPDDRHDQQF